MQTEDEIERSEQIGLKAYLLRAKGDPEGADKAALEFSTLHKIYSSEGRVMLLTDDQYEDYVAENDIDESLRDDGDSGNHQQA